MQMIQDGPYAHTPEKPLRMTGRADFCEVCVGRGGGGACVLHSGYNCCVAGCCMLLIFFSLLPQKAKLLVAELMDQKEMEVSGLDSLFINLL